MKEMNVEEELRKVKERLKILEEEIHGKSIARSRERKMSES
jgi:hypothetical protein